MVTISKNVDFRLDTQQGQSRHNKTHKNVPKKAKIKSFSNYISRINTTYIRSITFKWHYRLDEVQTHKDKELHLAGELITTDTKKTVGDGSTVGGVQVDTTLSS